MPYGLLTEHWQQIPRLQATETLQAFEASAVAGNVGLPRGEPQRVIKGWQKAARPRRRRQSTPLSREERLSRLAGLGIPIVFEEAPNA